MRKNLGEERGYLALEDLWIKSRFSRFNMPISEGGRGGERKNPRGRRKKMNKAREGRWLWQRARRKNYGAELGARLSCQLHVGLEPKSSVPGALASRRVSSVPASMAPS